MKTKYMLVAFIALLMYSSAEAQFFKKLKEKVTGSTDKNMVDLELEMTVNPYEVQLNQYTTFTIKLDNKGAIDATDINVKAMVPSGYQLASNQATKGSYSSSSGTWFISKLNPGASATLTVNVLVIADDDLMFFAEVTACKQEDTDSKLNNGVDTDNDTIVIDDPDDEDDGDAQNVIIVDLDSDSDSEDDPDSDTSTDAPKEDIKLVLKDNKGEIQYYYFDFESVAMRVEFDKKKEPPMYFDNAGYVYVSEKKDQYIKVPFKQMMSMKTMAKAFSSFGGEMPNAPRNNEPITKYGMDLGPNKFPILEWAFVYKSEYFEGAPDLDEETLTCRGASDCTKFTLNKGKDKGSYVLFDTKGRLAEIFSIKSGNAVYTYEECQVILPDAKAMNLPFSKF